MDKKKLAAAISAVFAYIKTAEEAQAFHAAQVFEPVKEVESKLHQIIQPGNIWGVSGRQAHMQSNSMMQMRVFK